jgi:hypothetical protein
LYFVFIGKFGLCYFGADFGFVLHSENGKLLLAIQKKDFSLFPKTEENSLVDNAVKLIIKAKKNIFPYLLINFV